MGRHWYLIVVLICVSLLTDDVERVFMDLLTTCISALDKCLFIDFVHLLNGLFFHYWVIRTLYTFHMQVLCQIYANLFTFFCIRWVLSHFKTLGSFIEIFCDYLAEKEVPSISESFNRVKIKYCKYFISHTNVLEWNECKIRSWRPWSSLGSVNKWESLSSPGHGFFICKETLGTENTLLFYHCMILRL